jgi:hypothetical protein
MSNTNARIIIEGIMEKQIIETIEALALRRWFYGEGLLDQEDAEALFSVNAALRVSNAEFSRLFVEILTDFVVYQQRPTGRISAEKSSWLIERMGGADGLIATRAELELLVAIVEEAHEVPADLAAFALAQVKHAAITGEGPAARGRIHFSRTVDAGDVHLIDRLLHRSAKAAGSAITRAEAEILFEIAEACTGANDEAWDSLFVEAIAGHLTGAALPGSGHFTLDLNSKNLVETGTADWLHERIHHDGQISSAEQALLAFINRAAPIQDSVARAAIIRMA